MCIVFIALIVILTLFLIYILNHNKKLYKDLKYIEMKINEINGEESSEKVFLLTENERLKSLLISINNILIKNQKNQALKINHDEQMKKMLSNISHDLKTPLTVILGYTEMLKNMKNLKEEDKGSIINSIDVKGKEVVDIINKFFDFCKLEGGDLNPNISKTNINDVCRNAILSYYEILEKANIKVEVKIPDKDVFIYTDQTYISRILSNLISNAYKYGYEGKIIGITLENFEEKVEITVWDKGRGIDEVYMERVFDRLYTLDDSRSKEFKSSGLGLTITKKLVERLGGIIELKSIPYELTSFKVILFK